MRVTGNSLPLRPRTVIFDSQSLAYGIIFWSEIRYRGYIMAKMIGLFMALMLGLIFVMPSSVPAAEERGQEPQCQEHCLATHIKTMRKLSEELAKTGEMATYQDQVELEISKYSACVTNCQFLLPVK